MSKLRRWALHLLVVLAIVPLASCGVMVPHHEEPDQIEQFINSKPVSAATFEQPTPLPSIPDATSTLVVQPATPVVQEKAVDPDDSLVDGLSDHFKQPKELVRRIVATATRLARSEFPTRDDILAVIAVESSFNPKASHTGSKGLMQIQLSAHRKELKGKNHYDVDDNIAVGAQILEDYYVQLDRSRRSAVLAYNAGIGSFLKKRFVEKYYRKYMASMKLLRSIHQ